MDNSMLIRWYSKIFDSYLLVKDFKGFGYFESNYSHGYVQATFRFNKLALEVIRFQLDLRGLNRRNTREISIIEEAMKCKWNSPTHTCRAEGINYPDISEEPEEKFQGDCAKLLKNITKF